MKITEASIDKKNEKFENYHILKDMIKSQNNSNIS